MSTINKIINNFRYQKYRRLREEAFINMQKCNDEGNHIGFKKWLGKYIELGKVCSEIEL